MKRLLILAALASAVDAATVRPALAAVASPRVDLVAAKHVEPAPAAKLLEVSKSAALETLLLLAFLRAAAEVVSRASGERSKFWIGQLAWVVVVQGSSRLQGYMQSNTQTLSPEWYDKLEKPNWNPPAWLFPVMWIPIKLAQTAAAGITWRALGHRTFSAAPVVMFLLHLSLGDIWNVQFFLKQRKLTGLLVIYTFWAALIASAVLIGRTSLLAGALVAPGVAWVAVAAALNLDIWYLNRHT